MLPRDRENIVVPDSSSGQSISACGAYGLRITGLEGHEDDLRAVPNDWPELLVRFRRGGRDTARPAGTIDVWADHAQIWLNQGDLIEIEREPLTVRFITRRAVPRPAIVHPFLGLPATIANRWLNRHALHAAAFLHRGRAWALLGDRETGKSSTLGCLARAGHPALTDDVLVVDACTAFSGPRSIDLREEAAHLGGQALGFVGNRERWRLRAGEAPPAAPLGGIIRLEWGDSVQIEPLGAEERLQSLITGSALPPSEREALGLLELAALPAWRFARPRDLAQLEEVTGRLLGVLGDAQSGEDSDPAKSTRGSR